MLSLAVLLLAADPAPPPRPAADAGVAMYEKDVRPLLQAHCLKCHGQDPKKVRGGLNLTTRKAALAGGDTGPVFDLKNPRASLFLKALHFSDGLEMPPSGKLPAKDIATFEKWVAAGVPMTEAGDDATAPPPPVQVADRNYWAYRPVKRPEVPAVKNAAWVKTPVDAFVLAKLEAKGLKPNAPADKVALVRRAYYDLTGLPPTPEQVDEFVKDPSPSAWPRLVDKLLDSPHYGEKWGRHWLDVVRYAETNGYERDGVKPHAWRFRDYVIKSFNDDKPFDRFAKEQIGGDELPDRSAETIVASGFYRLGLWDDEPADRELALYDGYDDLVTVTGQGFLGMTLNCCRCHDHKGDFFPQADYYRFVALFRDVRPFSYDTGPRGSSFTDITPPDRQKLNLAEKARRDARIAALAKQQTEIEDAAIGRLGVLDQWAAEGPDRDLVVDRLRTVYTQDEAVALKKIQRETDRLRKDPLPFQDLALCVANGPPEPPKTYVLVRGNPGSPGKVEMKPGFPEVLGFPDPVIPKPAKGATSSGRRLALANWIADPANPLPARVFANRVWGWHFGRGIVPTPNDFGKLGEPPTHPELLDWLAAEFVTPTWNPTDKPSVPWSVKRMHRLLMLSSTYQLSSAGEKTNLTADPANLLRWRFDMRRLAAEEVRDSILMTSGGLDPKPFGPSVFPKIPREVLAGQSRPGEGWHHDPRNPTAGNRRSVYVHVKRSLQVPILANHDQADTDSSCPVRYTTTVPTQALGMLNGEFTNDRAAALAARLMKESPGDLRKQVARGVRLTTGRNPTADEVAKDAAFVQSLVKTFDLSESAALTRYALLLLNANEFVYVD